MILGIDVSTYLEQQRLTHQKYYKDGKECDPFQLFKDQGVSTIRGRIWVNPYDEEGNPYLGGTCDLKNFIDTANFLKPYGFKYVVDFHYSDFWADPGKQSVPKSWKGLDFEQLKEKVYEHTKESLLEIKKNNIEVTHVQVGNEITHGMLWPFGELQSEPNRKKSFRRLCDFLKSGAKAVKEVYPDALIIIHLEESYNKDLYREYVLELRENNVPFDIIGSSYYPFWHHGFDEYFANMDMLINELHVKAMNVELGYPFTYIDYKKDENGKPKHLVVNADNIHDFLKMMPYGISKEAQQKFIKNFIKLCEEHKMEGIFYWEPLWVPGEGICWGSEAGQRYQGVEVKEARNEWANQCLFDYDGNMLPAFLEYKYHDKKE